ncbi:FecR family protein [Parapedobacter koreensis]|uniref:FecR family protein n=1 Tax=Parapedobacter koreensis TaxID=332977 RepID=A0A1H7LH60_9SPHI|nr:FecR domain-containing protein [Parapedobacter koreensis]SEK98281.1 FecR family protein [Parapedobacter koreensis]
MDNKTLEILIDKYLIGTCTPSEEQQLMDWYNMHEGSRPYTTDLDAERRLALEKSMFQQIKRRIATANSKPTIVRRLAKKSSWLYAAAAVVLLAIAFPFFNTWHQRHATFQTAYGEIKAIVLPDDSEVVLNGNSTIAYTTDENREIWLDGEASFKVTKKKDRQRFVVHLADTLSIEVVGTEFNVQKRTSGTQIALKSGKIRLHHTRKGKSEEIIAMEPNDVVYLGQQIPHGITKKINQKAIEHFAWQDHKILLDQTSFAEIQALLAETYDIQTVVLQDSALTRKASGSIPVVNDRQQLLNHIITLYGLVITDTNEEKQYVLTTQ